MSLGGPTYPRWPTWEPDEDAEPEKIFPVRSDPPDRPVDPMQLPHMAKLFTDHRGNFHVQVMWPEEIRFQRSKEPRKPIWFSASQYGSRENTKHVAFSYFRDLRSVANPSIRGSGKGELRPDVGADGLHYHGGKNHTFVCWR